MIKIQKPTQAGQYRLDPNSCLQVSVVGLEKGSSSPSLIGTALIRLFHTVEVLLSKLT